MKLTLILVSVTLALLVYWVARRLPLPPEKLPPRKWTILSPLEDALQQELDRAGWAKVPARLLLNLMIGFAVAGAALTLPFHNRLLMLIAAAAFGITPYQLVRTRIQQRARAVHTAVEPALIQIAKLCEVRHHPFLALSDALPMLEQPLQAELGEALQQTQAGLPLPDALRQMAHRCCDNFYLHQLAELVAINIRTGGDLAGSLQRLANRLRTMEELRAEEAAELFGYKWLTRLLFGAALLPLPYWALTGSRSLDLFVTDPVAQALLVWVVLSGLAIASLPYWLAIED